MEYGGKKCTWGPNRIRNVVKQSQACPSIITHALQSITPRIRAQIDDFRRFAILFSSCKYQIGLVLQEAESRVWEAIQEADCTLFSESGRQIVLVQKSTEKTYFGQIISTQTRKPESQYLDLAKRNIQFSAMVRHHRHFSMIALHREARSKARIPIMLDKTSNSKRPKTVTVVELLIDQSFRNLCV